MALPALRACQQAGMVALLRLQTAPAISEVMETWTDVLIFAAFLVFIFGMAYLFQYK